MTAHLDRCVDLLQRAIAVESLPGQEGELARLIEGEMKSLGYHEVRIDEVGNVLGCVRGSGAAEPLMFNTHLDHVDVGDPAAWPHPPFGGEIHDGRLWGRGAVDIKGPMAAQVIAVASLLDGEPPPGDVWVSCVVQEEIGGVGARHLARDCPARLLIVGEPSSCSVRRGHRGRFEPILHVRGRSVHASVPERGVNPLFTLGRFLARLDEIEHAEDAELGPSTVAPTLVRTDQTSANVVPAELWQTLDWRAVPGETGESVCAQLQRLAEQCADEGASAAVTLPEARLSTWTGRTIAMAADNPAYLLADDDSAVVSARAILEEVTGEDRGAEPWRFATDGGHFAAAGLVPVGFGPGDELLAHTVREHVELDELETALEVNRRFARELATRVDAL